MPDYIYIPEGSPLERRDVVEFIAAARQAALDQGEEPVDLVQHAARLRRLAVDPWETTRRELDEAFGAATSGGPEGSRHTASAVPDPPSPDAWLRWLEVAAAPAHVAAIRSQLPSAWQRLDEAPNDEPAG